MGRNTKGDAAVLREVFTVRLTAEERAGLRAWALHCGLRNTHGQPDERAVIQAFARGTLPNMPLPILPLPKEDDF
jgi:hypothetical protein